MNATSAKSGAYRVLSALGSRASPTHAGVRGQDLFVLQRFAAHGTKSPLEHPILRAAECAAKHGHPNVARVRHAELVDGEVVIATDFVDGMTLADLGGRLPPAALVRVVLDVLAGLQSIHAMRDERGLLDAIHGAVCPENVVVGKDGIARLIAPFRSRPIAAAGSEALAYYGPEVHEGGLVDARADLYGAATILWEGLQGARLFRGRTSAEILQQQRAEEIGWSAEADSIVGRLSAIVLRGLAFDPALRFRSAGELATALRIMVGKEIASGRTVAQLVTDHGADRIRARRAALDPRAKLRATRSEPKLVPAPAQAPAPTPANASFGNEPPTSPKTAASAASPVKLTASPAPPPRPPAGSRPSFDARAQPATTAASPAAPTAKPKAIPKTALSPVAPVAPVAPVTPVAPVPVALESEDVLEVAPHVVARDPQPIPTPPVSPTPADDIDAPRGESASSEGRVAVPTHPPVVAPIPAHAATSVRRHPGEDDLPPPDPDRRRRAALLRWGVAAAVALLALLLVVSFVGGRGSPPRSETDKKTAAIDKPPAGPARSLPATAPLGAPATAAAQPSTAEPPSPTTEPGPTPAPAAAGWTSGNSAPSAAAASSNDPTVAAPAPTTRPATKPPPYQPLGI